MPHLDDIWNVGGGGGGLGPKVRMVTLMEVKGHQRSNGVNYVLWLPYLVKRNADASWEWLWPLWRSKVIRGQKGKLCAVATIFGQKKRWYKLRMMMTFMKVKGHQRSNGVNYVLWLTIFGIKKRWCKLRMMMAFMKVKGHLRSNGVNYVLWLPYVVKRSADASWEWWWFLWSSKVIRGQMW